jgi:hypothetical protein|tara:strand:- start:119 stop:427 length:309 start_codon:yes stop_codon:yes gene_type:complete
MSDSNPPKSNYRTPKKNSSQWKTNEKIINENPSFKKIRDTVEGVKKSDGAYGSSHGGKGSASRTNYLSDQYADNYDKIFKKGKYAEPEVDPADTTWDDLSDD